MTDYFEQSLLPSARRASHRHRLARYRTEIGAQASWA